MPRSKDNHVLKKMFEHCSKLIFKIILNLIYIRKRKNFFIKFLNLIK